MSVMQQWEQDIQKFEEQGEKLSVSITIDFIITITKPQVEVKNLVLHYVHRTETSFITHCQVHVLILPNGKPQKYRHIQY